jgi:hypothetical protein
MLLKGGNKMANSTSRIYYNRDGFDDRRFINRYFLILLILPLSILLFVVFVPIILRNLNPAAEAGLFARQTEKACFGIVIPQDVTPFITTEKISFLDARAENQKKCFGIDLYF